MKLSKLTTILPNLTHDITGFQYCITVLVLRFMTSRVDIKTHFKFVSYLQAVDTMNTLYLGKINAEASSKIPQWKTEALRVYLWIRW